MSDHYCMSQAWGQRLKFIISYDASTLLNLSVCRIPVILEPGKNSKAFRES